MITESPLDTNIVSIQVNKLFAYSSISIEVATQEVKCMDNGFVCYATICFKDLAVASSVTTESARNNDWE